MYKLSETEILAQPSEYVDETGYSLKKQYETTEGDAGFLDSFNALKSQIDFNYKEYKEQLRTLLKRKEKLADDFKYSMKMLIIEILIPFAYALLVYLVARIGLHIGFFAVAYTFLVLFMPALFFICDFILAPAFMKNVVAIKKQQILMNSSSSMQDYRKKNGIISFEDEKTFLKNKINLYNEFYEDLAIEGWDKKDSNDDWKDLNELTDEQREILDRMRSLSVFQECHSTVMETKGHIGVGWLLVGFLFAVELVLFMIMLDKGNLGL